MKVYTKLKEVFYMYTVEKLAELYRVSKTTIYNKLKNDLFKDFIEETQKGIVLQQEGLNLFNTIMSKSKVATAKIKEDKKVESNLNEVDNNFNDEYIAVLKEQNEYLKNHVEKLQDEKKDLLSLLQTQTEITKNSQEKILLLSEPKKEKWWQFWKN